MTSEKLIQAVQLIKSGNKQAALPLLKEVVQADPNNENAWLWLYACVDKVEQKKYCVQQALRINPDSKNARMALSKLENKTGAFSEQVNPKKQSERVTEIGKLETELSKLEGRQREVERQLQSEKTSRNITGVVFVIAVLGSFIVNINMAVFFVMLLIFIMVGISSNRKYKKIQNELSEIENEIPKKRGRLAELRAQLSIG